MTRTSYLIRQRPRLVSLVAAGAVAVGTMLTTATKAAAEPISEGTIKSECKAAGGTYTKKGRGWSQCTYKDINGTKYTDDYVGGVYAGTNPAPRPS
ncbi:MAG TPA: hypothetical protein VKA77_10495 [Mycobacterium sp.]|nr:hypothetical protein [Mycobacterium sp.]